MLEKVLVVAALAATSIPAPAAAQARFCAGREVTIAGTDGADRIRGTRGRDVIAALGGDDVVVGGRGRDVVCDGDGDDVVRGGAGSDVLTNGEGDDALRGGRGRDSVGSLNDSSAYSHGSDVLSGGRGADELFAGSEQTDEVYDGGPGVDHLDLQALYEPAVVDLVAGSVSGAGSGTVRAVENVTGTGYADELRGDDGDNVLVGGLGGGIFGPTYPPGGVPDVVDGRGGDDTLDGGTGDDEISGGDGEDVVEDGLGRDSISGGPGADSVATRFTCAVPEEHCEIPQEGYYGDEISGGGGDDSLSGGLGDDAVEGGPGFDFLSGGDGADDLAGGQDGDRLRGGHGHDELDGGEGIDVAVFVDAPSAVAVDLAAATVSGGSDDSIGALESVAGSAFDDVLSGTPSLNNLFGGDGDDVLRGLDGEDFLDGGDGEDEIYGGAGDDNLDGGFGPRYIGHNQADGRPDLQDGGAGEDGCFASAFDELVGCEILMIE